MSVRSRILLIASLLAVAGPVGATNPRCSPPPGHEDGPPWPPPGGSGGGPPPPGDTPPTHENRVWRPVAAPTPVLAQQIVDGNHVTPATAWMAGHDAHYQYPGSEPVAGPVPPPDATPESVGTGDACRLLQIPHASTAAAGADVTPFYTESQLTTLATGESLELQMKVDARRFASAAGSAGLDFVEFDLERDGVADLLPLRLSLNRGVDGALRVGFRNAHSERVFASFPLRAIDAHVGMRWTALPRDQLSVTMLLDGQPVAQQILRGQVVALRIGLLEARGPIVGDRLVELDLVRIAATRL